MLLFVIATWLIVSIMLANFGSLQKNYRLDPWLSGTEITSSKKAKAISSLPSSYDNGTSNNKYITIVLFSDALNPALRPRRISAIAETWGPQANAIYAVPHDYVSEDYTIKFATYNNNNTKIYPPHIVNPSPGGTLQTIYAAAVDDEKGLAMKLRPKLLVLPPDMDVSGGNQAGLMTYVFSALQNLDDTFDFLLIANDHTFVLTDNLCQFLNDRDPSVGFHAGHALAGGPGKYPFNSIGMGYVLSRRSVMDMISATVTTTRTTSPTTGGKNEPLCSKKSGYRHFVTECLFDHFQTPLADTRDSLGRHRFHGYGVVRTMEGKQDEWYANFHQDPNNILHFRGDGAINNHDYSVVKTGRDCCSPNTCTFHYVQDAEARALFRVRETLQKNPSMSDMQLRNLMMELWPTNRQELGGYASPLPPNNAQTEQKWADLLHVTRHISTSSSLSGKVSSQCQ